MASCINCFAGRSATEVFRGDDGHFRKRCHDCGHEWGPFVSEQLGSESGDHDAGGQATLGSFT